MGFDLYGIAPVMDDKEKTPCPPKPDWDDPKWERKEAKGWPNGMPVGYYDAMNEWEALSPGTYFRASCWSWRPIQDIIAKVAPWLGDEIIQGLHYNDGYGPENEKDALQLSEDVEEWIDDVLMYSKDPDPLWQPYYELKDTDFTIGDDNPYKVGTGHLKEFALFCKFSGGFRAF